MAAVPLYLAGGVIITAAGRAQLGFWPAAGVALAANLAVKAWSTFALHTFLGGVRHPPAPVSARSLSPAPRADVEEGRPAAQAV